MLKQSHTSTMGKAQLSFGPNLRVLPHYLQPVGYLVHCDTSWTSLFAHRLLVLAEEQRGLC